MGAQFQCMMAQRIAAGSTPPAFGAEVQRWSQALTNASTSAITLSGGIAQGDTVVVTAAFQVAGQTVTGATDSRGNTYAVGVTLQWNTTGYVAIVYAYVGTALQPGDTITISYASTGYSVRFGVVASVTNAANIGQTDQTAGNSAYGTAVSATASTTATATTLFGIVATFGQTITYGSGSWTTSGAAHDYGTTLRLYYVYADAVTAGSKNPGGTLSAGADWAAVWIALK